MPIYVDLPLNRDTIQTLQAGDSVLLTGTLYTARDAAHKRMYETLLAGEPLPFDLNNQTLYYVGPTPAKPGAVIGSAGPTTSERMDIFTPLLLQNGLNGMIGKGHRNQEVKDTIRQEGAVYFAAIGGSAALLAQRIKKTEVIAYDDLGTEAIRKLEIEQFPVIVINDAHGADYYQQGVQDFLNP